MAEYLVTDTELTSIADAIRDKADVENELEFPSEFVNAIDSISTEPDTLVIWPETHFTISGSSSDWGSIPAPKELIVPGSERSGLIDIIYDGVLYEDIPGNSEGVYLDNFNWYNSGHHQYVISALGGNHTIKALYKRAKTPITCFTVAENAVVSGTYDASGKYYGTINSSTAISEIESQRANKIKIIINNDTHIVEDCSFWHEPPINVGGCNFTWCTLELSYTSTNVLPFFNFTLIGTPNTSFSYTMSIYGIKDDGLIVAPHGVEYFAADPGVYDVATYRYITIGEPALEDVEITATATTQVVSARTDLGYVGLSRVTINPPPLSTITIMPTNQMQTVTPTGTYVGFQQVTVGAGTADPYVQRLYGTLDSYTNSTLTNIISYAFVYDSTLTYANFPNVTSIANSAFYQCTNLETLLLPKVTNISSYAFEYCFKLSELSCPELSYIGTYAFAYASSLTTLSLPKVSSIMSNAFVGCQSIASASLPSLLTLGSQAFSACRYLSYVSVPNVKSIYGSTFYSCGILNTFYGPNVTYIGSSAFYSCVALSNATFSTGVTFVGAGAFFSCSNMKAFNFPSLTTVGSSAFRQCYNVSSYSLPLVRTIYPQAFGLNYSLTTLSLPSCSAIGSSAFFNCSNFMSLYLLGSYRAVLSSTTAFGGTPMSTAINGVYGSIYVPTSLYASYVAAANWSAYADRFVSI